MYFITKKDSETGKKFQVILNKAKEIDIVQKQLAEEIGFHGWRTGYWCAFGGFSELYFKETPDPKVYRNADAGGWFPKKNSKAGKLIYEKLKAAPKVFWEDLNLCIGWKESFKHIGVRFNNDLYFGFAVKPEWKVIIPPDCEEITYSKYQELFKPSEENE